MWLPAIWHRAERPRGEMKRLSGRAEKCPGDNFAREPATPGKKRSRNAPGEKRPEKTVQLNGRCDHPKNGPEKSGEYYEYRT
jgi:hypothetical protein